MAKDRFGYGTNVLDKVREVYSNREAVAPPISEPLAFPKTSSYNAMVKYKDEPHFSDKYNKQAPTLLRNNPEYKGLPENIGPEYYNYPKLWGNPPAEERYWSDPNVKRTLPELYKSVDWDRVKDALGFGGYQEGGEVKPSKDRFGFGLPVRDGMHPSSEDMEKAHVASGDFLKAYARGNAYLWGRFKGEGLVKGLGAIFKHGNQFKKFENDPGFREFVEAKTTPEKVAVIEKYFGDKIAFEFGDYEMEDWDEHFRRQNAVMPRNNE